MEEVKEERLDDPASDSTISRLSTMDPTQANYNLYKRRSKFYLNSSRDLVLSVWKPNLLVILFFMQLILFDMIADIYFIRNRLVAVSIFFIWIWFVFWDRMERMSYCMSSLYSMYMKSFANDKELMRKGDGSESSICSSSRDSYDSTQNRVELGDVKNPIQSQSSRGVY
jgi:hypothetical protein